jgi:hypothetical protein
MLANLLLNFLQLLPHELAIVIRRTMNEPFLFFPLMCGKPELTQPLSEALLKTVCVSPMLEAQVDVVRIADDIDIALRILPAPEVHQRSKA